MFAIESLTTSATMRAFQAISSWLRTWTAPNPLGRRGEDAAARFLRRLGYVIVARGHRDKIGEIDLIAVDGRTVVFVEVKTRTGELKGTPAEAVDEDKQRRLTRLAAAYMKRHDLLDCKARFDIVAVTWPAASRQPRIEHIKDAFEAVGMEGLFS